MPTPCLVRTPTMTPTRATRGQEHVRGSNLCCTSCADGSHARCGGEHTVVPPCWNWSRGRTCCGATSQRAGSALCTALAQPLGSEPIEQESGPTGTERTTQEVLTPRVRAKDVAITPEPHACGHSPRLTSPPAGPTVHGLRRQGRGSEQQGHHLALQAIDLPVQRLRRRPPCAPKVKNGPNTSC